MTVEAESFHLNGHIIGFRPQTQKLESSYKTPSNTLAVKGAMTRGYCCSRSILFRSSQLLFKLTQSINTIERFEYNKKDCEEGKEIFQFWVHCSEFGIPK